MPSLNKSYSIRAEKQKNIGGVGADSGFPGTVLLAFVNGYMTDILLPFAMYLVLGVARQSILHNGIARGGFVFAIGFITETLQYFGIPIFGQTFDLLDDLMFGIGIGFAVVFERIVLSKIPVVITPLAGE